MSLTERVSYFRAGTFHDIPYLDAMKRGWYSGCLERAGEPVFWPTPWADTSMVRLLWIPAFGLPAVSRITKRGSSVTLDAADEPRGRTHRPLAESDWDHVLRLIADASFWDLPTRQTREGYDGEMWLLEAVVGERHHLVDRWCPETGAVRDIGLALARLAGWPSP